MKKGMWKSLATLTKTGKAKGKTLPDKPKSAREKEKDEATVKPSEGPEQSCPRSNGRLTRCASMEDVSVVSSAFFTDAHATAEKGDEQPEWKHADVNRTFVDRRRKSKSVDITNLKGNLIIPPNNSPKNPFRSRLTYQNSRFNRMGEDCQRRTEMGAIDSARERQ